MILVSGSLAYDYIMDFPGYFRDHILPEKLHVLSVSFLIDKMQKNFGGTAGNIAYNLALLGEKPTILASAGNDFKEYERWFKTLPPLRGGAPPLSGGSGKRIDLSYVHRVKDMPTASAHIITDQSDCQIAGFYPGAMQYGSQSSVHSSQLFKKAKLSIVSPGNLEDMKALPRVYKKYGIPYIYDPGQNIPALSGADLRAGITGAKVFISNDYELALVLKKTRWKKQDMLKRVGALVTTLGDKGSIIEVNPKSQIPNPKQIQNSKFKIQKFTIPPSRPDNTCDPTGAGDAYRAGFIKGLLIGLPYDKIGKLASIVSVYTVEKYGTQTHQFTWQGLLKRYRENFNEDLSSSREQDKN